MLVLVRKGAKVYHNEVELKINKQASKGPGNEVVSIAGLEGSNGAKWVSLSKLEEGRNELNPQARKVTSTSSYKLTPEEKAEVDNLQAQIDAIKEAAKKRYVAKPKFLSTDEIAKLSKEEKAKYIAKYEKYLQKLISGATA